MLWFSMVNYLLVRSLVMWFGVSIVMNRFFVMRLGVSIVMNRLFTVIPLTVNQMWLLKVVRNDLLMRI